MDKAWTTGITVCHIEDGWYASCDWKFGKHMESGCMEGTINTRYYEKSLVESIDYVLNCMERMGVKRSDEVEELNDILGFALYYDEESKDELTEEIKAEIKNEGDRRGWKCYIGE